MEEPGEDIQVENSAGKDSLEEQDVATDGEDGDEISSAVEKGLGRLRKGSQVQAAMLTNVARGEEAVDEDGCAGIERSMEQECAKPLQTENFEQDQGQSVDTGGLDAREECVPAAITVQVDADTENKQEEAKQALSERQDDMSAGDGDMASKEEEPEEEDEEDVIKALMGADSGISEELEEDSRSSSIEKAESESGVSSANVNQDADDLESKSVAFKPAKTGTLDLAVVLERIKRKAGRATVSHGARKEQPEEDTRVSIDNEERDDNISDQENGFMIDTVEDTILSASIPKDILKRLEEKCTNHEASREKASSEQGKPDENIEGHCESAECDTKEDLQADDDQDEERQDSECSSDPESCSTDNSDEADREEREFLEETRLLRQIEKDNMNSCNELEFRSQLSGSLLVEELMDNSRSRPLSNPVFQPSGKGSVQTPNRPSGPILGKTKKKQVTRTLLDTCQPDFEGWTTLNRTSSLNQTLSKPTAPKRSRIFVYSSNEGSKDAGSRGHSQSRQIQESKGKGKGKENNVSRPKQQNYHGKRSLFELVTSQDHQTSRPDNVCTLSELNSALGHVRKAVTGPR